MDRKNSWIAGGLIVIVLVLVMGAFIFYIPDSTDNSATILNSTNSYSENSLFDNKTPEEKALFLARLNKGQSGFDSNLKANASLTSDGKYWIVKMDDDVDNWIVRVDAKTWMSKEDNGSWMSLDELKARYIAEIQSGYITIIFNPLGKPHKITMDGKEIWKVSIKYSGRETEYVYVDLVTGKSKNTDDWFNSAAGTDGWLTLNEVDQVIDKLGYYPNRYPFKDVLRDSYPEYNNSSYKIPDYWLSFDNSTPETSAISIARLSQGVNGFVYYNTANASLTSDGKYWIVEMGDDRGERLAVVTVDAKTWVSKEDNGTWRSLDELKASYIADVYCMGSGYIGPEKPYKVTLGGKTIWKVPCIAGNCDIISGVYGYVYFDPITGRSKGFSIDNDLGDMFKEIIVDFGGGDIINGLDDSITALNCQVKGTEGWSTLKELDGSINEMYVIDNPDYSGRSPFKDALRNLYSE